jgi:hypothetical protein
MKRHLWLLVALPLLAFTASAPWWATDEAGAQKALEERELKPVTVGGYDSLGCLLDLYSTRFTAEDKDGKPVSGTVCTTPGIARARIEFDRK